MYRLISDPLGLKAAINELRGDLRTVMSSVERKLEEISEYVKEQKAHLDAIESNTQEHKTALSSELDRINYQMGEFLRQLGTIDEHVIEDAPARHQSDSNLDDEIAKIVASMSNMNSNIAQLFECLIELDRSLKALVARPEKL